MNYGFNKSDRFITNKAISLTPTHKLVELFGRKKSYEISKKLNISYISNKAFYKLTDKERYYLDVRSKVAYPALKAHYTRKAEAALGFDFNTNFGLKKHDDFNIQSLSDFEDGETEQQQHIPLSQDVLDKIMAAKKYHVDVQPSPKSNLADYGRTASYFLCEVDNQIVPVVMVERVSEIQNTNPTRYSQSISVFILLKGRIPFFVSRLDYNPFNKHTNRLKDGHIATSKIKSRGTHQHIYSERFAILVPSIGRIMHCDAETYNFLHSFEDAKNFVKKQINTTMEHNPVYESMFKNDVQKAHKQKKYNTSKANLLNNFDDYNLNF